MAFAEEPILSFPSPLVPLRNARSTIILGSCNAVRGAGMWDRYVAGLGPEYRDAIEHAVAGTWLATDVALAHYQACDKLGLSVDEQFKNGLATFDRIAGTLLGTALRMAREIGVTPWKILPHYQRFYERGYDGSGLRVVKIGPKEAQLELAQSPLCESRYYRNALRGVAAGLTGLFCSKVYVTELTRGRRLDSVALRLQWA